MRVVAMLSCLALIGGCGYDGSPTYPRSPSVELTLSSREAMTSAGETRAVAAVVKDANQRVVPSPSLTWTSSAPAVAVVTGTAAGATITAVDDGTATISATDGLAVGTITVTVHRALASVVLTTPALDVPYGSTMQLTATAFDARQNALTGPVTFTYSSSNPGAIMVSAGGELTPLFQLPLNRVSTITATLTWDGVTASDFKAIVASSPANPDYGAVMRGDFVLPARVPTTGAGVAFLFVHEARIDYIITWSALSGPATDVHVHAPGSAGDLAGVLVDLAPRGQGATFGTLIGSITAADIRPQGGQPPISLDSLITLLGDHSAYVDVHTAAFSGGEIRGQFVGPLR